MQFSNFLFKHLDLLDILFGVYYISVGMDVASMKYCYLYTRVRQSSGKDVMIGLFEY